MVVYRLCETVLWQYNVFVRQCYGSIKSFRDSVMAVCRFF